MRKALVTGVAGFAGSYLAEYLISKGIFVFGFFRPDHSFSNIQHLKNKIKLVPVNLLQKKEVEQAVSPLQPNYVFHLAAFSSPTQSFSQPRQTLENNIVGQLNLLEALVKTKSKARILIVGSADEYGNIDPTNLPATEETPLAPISPYAVSKVAQDMLGFQFFINRRLQIVRVRPFNHIGPRQSKDFVIPSFASQIAALEKKGGGTMKVGNLDSWRDFTDVRDMVRAYLLALEKGIAGEVYNIGSGKPVKIKKILQELISLSPVKIDVDRHKNLLPPIEVRRIYCDFSKFRKQTGWEPVIALSKTLSDTIEYERSKVR